MKTIEDYAREFAEQCERGWQDGPLKTLPFAMREGYELAFYKSRCILLAYEIALLRDTTYRVKADCD